jgi:hypothetical protein
MRQVTKISLVLLVSIFALMTFVSPVAAAPAQSSTQKTMKLQITIDDPNAFWTYPYINHQSEVLKPSLVAVEWSIGQLGHNLTKATIVNQGKATGELAIVTDKDALVNIRVMVCDSKGNILGTSSGLEYNRGQTKAFTIALPDFTEPKITIN